MVSSVEGMRGVSINNPASRAESATVDGDILLKPRTDAGNKTTKAQAIKGLICCLRPAGGRFADTLAADEDMRYECEKRAAEDEE